MNLLNVQVRQTLDLVRLRQIPWHKNKAIFTKLQSVGLIEPVHQRTLTQSVSPPPLIAVMTEQGKIELERLSECRGGEIWGDGWKRLSAD